MPKSHHERRQTVCILCLQKCDKLLKENCKNFIESNIIKNFESLEEYLPSGLCESCRGRIRRCKNPKNFKVSYNLEILANKIKKLPPLTRANLFCSCEICKIGRHTAKKKENYFFIK